MERSGGREDLRAGPCLTRESPLPRPEERLPAGGLTPPGRVRSVPGLRERNPAVGVPGSCSHWSALPGLPPSGWWVQDCWDRERQVLDLRLCGGVEDLSTPVPYARASPVYSLSVSSALPASACLSPSTYYPRALVLQIRSWLRGQRDPTPGTDGARLAAAVCICSTCCIRRDRPGPKLVMQ